MEKADLLFLKKLTNAFGPSGNECAVRDLIAEKIRGYVDSLSVDGMGNLVATKGDSKDIFICAHMDEVGFMITSIQENGTLRFSQIGGVDPKFLASKKVVIGKNRIVGVIGAKPIHLSRSEVKETSYDDLYIDIGCDSFNESSKHISVGDSAVFLTDFTILGENGDTVCAKALDNRLGCYLLCKLLEEDSVKNGTFLFTVQEETGLRGATAFLKKHPFALGIALDTTTANDLPKICGPKKVCSINSGPVISFADGATVYNRNLIRRVFKLLGEHEIPAQTKGKRTGGNEASAIEKVGIGARSISVSVPCRYIHGPVGIAKICDIENTMNALRCITENAKELMNA